MKLIRIQSRTRHGGRDENTKIRTRRWVRDALGLDRPDAAKILRRCPQVMRFTSELSHDCCGSEVDVRSRGHLEFVPSPLPYRSHQHQAMSGNFSRGRRRAIPAHPNMPLFPRAEPTAFACSKDNTLIDFVAWLDPCTLCFTSPPCPPTTVPLRSSPVSTTATTVITDTPDLRVEPERHAGAEAVLAVRAPQGRPREGGRNGQEVPADPDVQHRGQPRANHRLLRVRHGRGPGA